MYVGALLLQGRAQNGSKLVSNCVGVPDAQNFFVPTLVNRSPLLRNCSKRPAAHLAHDIQSQS